MGLFIIGTHAAQLVPSSLAFIESSMSYHGRLCTTSRFSSDIVGSRIRQPTDNLHQTQLC